MSTATATVPGWMLLPGLEWLLADWERQKKPPTTVQTLIFPKDKWDNLAAVKKWAKDHDFKTSKVDETSTSWRLRQRPPGDFKDNSLRTICIAGAKDPGNEKCRVKAVIGRLKGAKKSESVPLSDGEITVPKHRTRQSHGLCLDRSRLATRQNAPNGEEFDHRFIASTETLASDGGVILLSAWRLARYQARPRWIAMHDVFGWSGKLTEITLGKAIWAGIEDGFPISQVGETGRALVIYVRYADTAFAQEVKHLYEEGGLDDVSVRWDPRTEEVRNPFEEEVQKYGEGTNWVAIRTDLIELSAVLLGADQGPNMTGGAQLIRAAFERCRADGHTMKEVPALIDKLVEIRQRRQQDEAALTDSLGLLQQAIDAFDAWLQGSGDIREALGDAVANLAALLSQDQQTGKTSAGDGDSDDDDRQGGLTVDKLRAAVEALTDAIEKLMTTRASGEGDGEGGAGSGGGDGAGGGDGTGGDGGGDATRTLEEQLNTAVDKRLEAVESSLGELTELLKARPRKPKAEDEDDKKKKGKKGKVVSGGDQQGGDGGEKYDATKDKGKGKKGDDPPEGGEREGGSGGGGAPTGEAGAGDGDGAGEGGGDGGSDGGGDGERRVSWSEMGDDDEVDIDFEAILADGSGSEADKQ